MKRPPGLWFLLSAGVLWLSLQDVYGIRATSLIFGKSTTTTTSTTEGAVAESSDDTATETSPEVGGSNVTKANLTGIPQIDYLYDPNLPQELNGYNLSEYPFYERVPDEEFDFKCDGLHDGFYASVPHKCQVYHHCLFGTRYDFLCANYTAFDQKTFICHFVSEVDCVNSKKYWHRNDALYQTASTTTVKPVVVYTPPPQPPPVAVAPAPINPRRPPSPNRRRPFRRRRPQYDYYEYDDEYEDEYYEERSRPETRRRKRPRPRPRPVYEDDYEEYEDDRYERRGNSRRDEDRPRKSFDRRGSDDRRPSERRRPSKDRRTYEDDDKLEDDSRKTSDKRTGERRYHKRRPADDDYLDDESDRRISRPKGGPRRPIEDEYEDDLPLNDKPANPVEDKPLIKPTSGSSIYDRPRAAPRIKPPVPKNEANKYAFKSTPTKPPVTAPEDEDYYEDYEEVPPKRAKVAESRHSATRRDEESNTRKPIPLSASRIRPQPSKRDDLHEEVEEDKPPRRVHKDPRPKYGSNPRNRPSTTKKPVVAEDYYYDYEEEMSSRELSKETKNRPTTSTTSTTTPASTTTTRTTKSTTTTTTPAATTKDITRDRSDSIVRIVKRPIIPSRSGNLYSARGLQPADSKASDSPLKEEPADTTERLKVDSPFKPSPIIYKLPAQNPRSDSQDDEFKPVSNRPQTSFRQSFKPKEYTNVGPRTTQKPKLPSEPDPLDVIEENEYDVTLNDALNPTLPNLPVRGFPTGFSAANDYSYSTFQRPRYVVEPAGSDYVYQQVKPVRQRYEAPVQQHSGDSAQEQFVNSDVEYKGQYSTIHGQNHRPRVTQAYFSSY